jgi:hypothetical protein
MSLKKLANILQNILKLNKNQKTYEEIRSNSALQR